MRNYFKAKLDTVQKISWSNQGIFFTSGNQGTTRTLHDLVTLCPDWAAWQQLFHTFKLTGMAVTVTPNHPTINYSQNSEFSGAGMLGFLTTRDNVNWNNVSESNFSFCLTPSQVQRKYKSFNGSLAAWCSTDDNINLDGKFAVETDGNPVNGGVYYMVKFTFYITFKNPN